MFESSKREYEADLSKIDFETEYRSSKEDTIGAFLTPCLRNSILYERAAGYFKSTVLNVVGREVAEFARRGGKLRIVCSPNLTNEDIECISAGYAKYEEVMPCRLIEDIDELIQNEDTKFRLKLLALLVSHGAIEIKLAIRRDRRGLYHEKIGAFHDEFGNVVTFKGSANETWSGWHIDGNFESIEVFCSWREGLESVRVAKHCDHLNNLWNETDDDVETFKFPKHAIDYLRSNALSLDEFQDFIKNRSNTKRKTPLPHQLEAIENWKQNGSRGIFQHATGSGKTVTALIAISDHVSNGKPALVLVPSRLLLKQWREEIESYIPDSVILLAGGGNNGWKKGERLSSFSKSNNRTCRIILSTMQTASTNGFIERIDQGEHLMLVADEVHQMGSLKNSRFFGVCSGPRLGLSATPERYGDEVGTKKILSYFERIVPPVISINDAIEAGRLVKYEYYPHAVNLNSEESEEWSNLTTQINKEIARTNSDFNSIVLTERAKLLLIQRSRIAKKAAKKIDLSCEILNESYEKGQSWLVYCEDADQLESIRSKLQEVGIDTNVYHTGMSGDMSATLEWFKKFGGVLVSIRCLDEGIDIPDISHALILASSQNPRQFIQRRGRVLRKAKGKYIAVIHDAIVVPVDKDEYEDQTGLLESELVRAIEFARNAINKGSGAFLQEIASNMGLDLEKLVNVGYEVDDERI